jgi:hypothetical protein
MIKLNCELCGNEFERGNAQVKQSKKLGRKMFCSLGCSAKANKNIPLERMIGRKPIPKIILTCEICNKQFERSAGETNRNKKLNRRVYCSKKCLGKGNINNIPIEKRYHPENLRRSYWVDDYSPFRLHFRCAKRRSKKNNKSFSLSLCDLKELWDKQKGVCPYTGWQLDLPRTSSEKRNRNPKRASLDRKDSSKGYTPDNVQFVSYMANCAKNVFSESELIAFCEAVVQHKHK